VLRTPGGAALDPALDAAAVRDTIARVFEQAGYDPSLRQSLGDRFLDWMARQLLAVADVVSGFADLRLVFIGTAIALVALVLLRALVLAGSTQSVRGPRRRTQRDDPWKAAEERATAGEFTDAAHLLYAAVLGTVATRNRVLLHPARTAGEYERELRSRNARSLPAFTAFTRAYERTIWRERDCTHADYLRLAQLAGAVAHADTGGVAA
jgi:hypothetical protein